jgi:hypothetical protein
MHFDPSDLAFVLFIAIVIWLATSIDGGGGGGGRRSRVPVHQQ